MVYRPPTKGTMREVPYLAIVNGTDADFNRSKHRAVEYAFERRLFFADPYQRGAYNSFSNTYQVGQPHGGDILRPVTFDSVDFNMDRTTTTFDGVEITMDSQ